MEGLAYVHSLLVRGGKELFPPTLPALVGRRGGGACGGDYGDILRCRLVRGPPVTAQRHVGKFLMCALERRGGGCEGGESWCVYMGWHVEGLACVQSLLVRGGKELFPPTLLRLSLPGGGGGQPVGVTMKTFFAVGW